MKISTSLLLTLFLSLSSLLLATPVHAQSSVVDLAISPPVEYLQLKPGEKLTHTVSLHHRGSTPVQVTVEVVDFTTDTTTGHPIPQEESKFKYIRFANPELQQFRLEPNEKKSVPFLIEPPETYLPKEHHLTILFSARPESWSQAATQSQVTTTIGSNLILFIGNPSNNKGEVLLNHLKAPVFVDSFQTLKFSISAKNDGNKGLPASGSATITDWRNQTVAEYAFFPDIVLAGSTRPLRWWVPTPPEIPLDPSAIREQFVYKKVFLIGIYKININLNTNNNSSGKSSSAVSRTVIALPFSLLLAIVAGVSIFFISQTFNRKFILQKPEKPSTLK